MRDHPRTLLVLWDVDHTLVNSGGVSHETYALAFRILFGRTPDRMPWIEGLTDVEVINRIFAANDVAVGPAGLAPVWAALEEAASQNRAALRRRGRALPGARAALAGLSREDGVIQSVLTGNIRPTAAGKLAAFDLDTLVDLEIGSFGDESADRAALVPSARARARERYGFDPTTDVTVLIGDTPTDVRAGRTHGACVIGVATGRYAPAELATAGATDVLPDLTDLSRLTGLLNSYRACAPILR